MKLSLRQCILAALLLAILSGYGDASSKTLDLKSLPADPRERAVAIMDYVDDLWRGASSMAQIHMRINTEHWMRELSLVAWSLGKDYSLVRITSPEKEAGVTTLKRQTNIYNYLPKTDRTVKITSSMMMSSWMGSHFTNDDLVKESRYAVDYYSEVVFDGDMDGKKVWQIQLMPKPDAAVVWGKIIFTVDQKEIMPVKSVYYDESGGEIRTILFSDYRMFGDRLAPSRMRLEPKDSPREFTELQYQNLQFDVTNDPDFFSIQKLKEVHLK
jgi:hypothetical protein